MSAQPKCYSTTLWCAAILSQQFSSSSNPIFDEFEGSNWEETGRRGDWQSGWWCKTYTMSVRDESGDESYIISCCSLPHWAYIVKDRVTIGDGVIGLQNTFLINRKYRLTFFLDLVDTTQYTGSEGIYICITYYIIKKYWIKSLEDS